LESDERRQFEQTTLPHFDAAYNLARWLTRDDHAAEDVVQEAFYRAARYFQSFRGGDARVWLLGIVRRSTFDWLKKNRSMTSFDEQSHDIADETANPALIAVQQYEIEQLRETLDGLPEQLREVIVLRELEGMSYQQIANIVEVPIGTVMSRISRGRKQIQTKLAPLAEGEPK
jgi:RNA polymerase sigma-70 factor (ECF subfamily)